MKRAMWIAIGLSLGLTANALAQACGAQGRFRAGFADFSWESGCAKPQPSLYARRTDENTRAFNMILGNYATCLRQRASSDAQYAADKVYKDAAKEMEDVKADARLSGFVIR